MNQYKENTVRCHFRRMDIKAMLITTTKKNNLRCAFHQTLMYGRSPGDRLLMRKETKLLYHTKKY